ncbi:MAG: hypothetical protein ACE5EE_10695, partial [Fidelibacterota bacterium]
MKKIAITIFLMVLFSSFGLFAQTDWVKYTENPVLDVGPPGSWDDVEIWPTRVLLLDSVYHMWYSGYSGTTIRIGHATSPDGISWTKDTLNPILTGDWAYVISTPLEYKMWYYSGNNIRYATSLNGLEWTTHPEPVLSPGPLNWDGVSVNGPSVMETLDGYEMWYHGFRGYELAQIGYATAVNETTWTKADDINPVLTDGDTGEWDSREVFGPRVLYNADSERYEMWYAGTISNYLNTQVGYAWSQDGLVWEKDSLNPVLNVDEGPELAVIHGDIILDPEAPPDERYKMWYAGYTGSRWWIGYATAPSDSLSLNDVGNSLPVKFALHQNH